MCSGQGAGNGFQKIMRLLYRFFYCDAARSRLVTSAPQPDQLPGARAKREQLRAEHKGDE